MSGFKVDRRLWRFAALAGSCLHLSACALLEKEFGPTEDPLAALPDPNLERIAVLESELVAAQAKTIELQKKVADLERQKAREVAAAEATLVAPPTLKEEPKPVAAAPLQPPPEIKPETVVAAADADRALAAAPAAPVASAPRLVQPTFASQDAVFENEAEADDGIRTASVLFGVHLASYRHAEEARTGWVKLQRDFPSELGLLEPRLERVEVQGRGAFLRLIGGGFASEEKATSLCTTLKSLGAYCAVAGFEGERLSFAENKTSG